MGRKRVEAPAALPEPPKGKRDKLEQLAGRMKNWRPAREILRPVQAVPTIFPWLDYATKVNGYPTQRICVVHGPSAEGKALPVDTPVLTPKGWRAIGDLGVGDLVIGSDGKGHPVLGVFPQGPKQVFLATFADRSSVECCDEHLWLTRNQEDRSARSAKNGAVRSLAQIRKHRARAHSIPLVQPVEFDPLGELPLNPYVLGLILGDGSFASPSNVVLCNPEPDIREAFARLLPRGDLVSIDDELTMRVVSKHGSGGGTRTRTARALHALGLFGLRSYEKFIPELYMYASVDERRALLAGLLDSDGYVMDSGGLVEFTSTSFKLFDQVAELVRGLGGVAVCDPQRASWYVMNGVRHSTKDHRRMRLRFPEYVPVRSKKHLAKWRGRTSSTLRSFHSVVPSRVVECVCIAVDSPDRLYVTKDYILTHNTELALGLGLSFLKKRHLFAHVDAEYTTPITWLQELLKGYEDDPLFMALRPKSYEHTVDSVREVLKMMIAGKKSGELAPETSGLIVLDSLRKLVPENFLAKIARFGAQGQKGSVDGMNGMGAAIKAKMNSDWFDELTPMLYEAGAGMLIIGRESENRDAKEMGQSWKLTGGRSLLFESSLMMRVERDWVREGAGDDSVIVGERHDVGIYKSKVAGKADDVETFSFFTSNGKVTPEGFDPARDMFELGIALEVVKQAGSWYSFGGKRFQGKSQGVKRLAADVTMRGDLDAAIRREFAKTAVPAEVRP